MADPQAAGLALAEPAIGALGRFDLGALGFAAHRHVAGDLAVFPDGRGVGLDPVVVAVLAPVLDVADPGAPSLEIVPEILEGLSRHVGVADDVVGFAQEFGLGKAADLEEIPVDVGDPALEVGLGNDQCVVPQGDFDGGDRLVVAHYCCLLVFVRCCPSDAWEEIRPADQAPASSINSMSRLVMSWAISMTMSMR